MWVRERSRTHLWQDLSEYSTFLKWRVPRFGELSESCDSSSVARYISFRKIEHQTAIWTTLTKFSAPNSTWDNARIRSRCSCWNWSESLWWPPWPRIIHNWCILTSGMKENTLGAKKSPVLSIPRKVLYSDRSCQEHSTSGPDFVPELMFTPSILYSRLSRPLW